MWRPDVAIYDLGVRTRLDAEYKDAQLWVRPAIDVYDGDDREVSIDGQEKYEEMDDNFSKNKNVDEYPDDEDDREEEVNP